MIFCKRGAGFICMVFLGIAGTAVVTSVPVAGVLSGVVGGFIITGALSAPRLAACRGPWSVIFLRISTRFRGGFGSGWRIGQREK